jgi:hypothetical protein
MELQEEDAELVEEDAVLAKDAESEVSPEDETPETSEAKRPWEVSILLARKQELCMPLTWQVSYEDGETETYEWTRAEQLKQNWYRWSFESERKVTSVVIDPDSRYWIDADMSDNQWHQERDEITPLRYAERVLSQWEHMMLWYMSLGG